MSLFLIDKKNINYILMKKYNFQTVGNIVSKQFSGSGFSILGNKTCMQKTNQIWTNTIIFNQ